MDVKYISSDWEKTKQGLGEFVGGGHWTLSPFATLNEICNNLDSVESLIRKYDSDGFVTFSYDNQKNKYYQLNEDFQALHLFVGEVGAIVDDVIDERFYKDMDKFVEAIRDLTIEEYKTTNRIGAMQKVNTDYIPSGEIPKAQITLDDLFGGENFYADQIKLEYEQIKEMHPDQEFSLEEYRQVALNTHAFEYTSIKDQQYNKEFWVSIAALVVIVGAALIFPPAGIALGAVYGTLELSTAVTGKDWVSGREVGTGERWFRGLLAPLDLIPAVGSVKKFAILGRAGKLKQAATISLKTSPAMRLKDTVKGSVHTARLEGMKRMNQLKDFAKGRAVAVGKKLEKDIIDTAKGIDKGVAAFNRFRESALPNPQLATPDGAIVSGSKVENTHAAENFFRAKIEDVKGIGKGNKGISETNLRNIDDFINGNKKFDEVIEDYAKLYQEKIISNTTWSWNKSFPGADNLTARQKRLIKEKAMADGLIPEVTVTKVEGMRYGYADFKSAGLVVDTKQLPEKLWLRPDEEQFKWLDKAIGGRPKGMTWHHTEIPGKMELVPFGIHNITIHNGGRSPGMWADAPR